MGLKFGEGFYNEFLKFKTLTSAQDFKDGVVDFACFIEKCIQENHSYKKEILEWKTKLFNKEKHFLYPHQVQCVKGCIEDIVLSDKYCSGYCFLPTSAGKSYILIALAGLGVGNFEIFRTLNSRMPEHLKKYSQIYPIWISLSIEYSKMVKQREISKTQILVHDKLILEQIELDTSRLLGNSLKDKIEFYSIQAMGNPKRRKDLHYVIIDECHWGNASEEETIQSSLIGDVKDLDGDAFGFTASPYESPDGKFQKTWSGNQINKEIDFNYFLDKGIIYPITLREVNLQNARADFEEGSEEIDLTEKSQVVGFMADHILSVIPRELDGPAICFFNHVIIPDMVRELTMSNRDNKALVGKVKVLASDDAEFSQKCKNEFGSEILATKEDVENLKKGEKIFLISWAKLLVGLNAPYLRYCFISPTNSKIMIMQGVGRLMRPMDFNIIPKKLATLFLTSLSGKRLNISSGDDAKKGKERQTPGHDDPDNPRSKYVTCSMTFSEAYDLPNPVFYKTEVGFRDFFNEKRIKDGNTVEILKRRHIPKEDLDEFDPIRYREQVSRTRDKCRAFTRPAILKRDNYQCQGKKFIGKEGCNRGKDQVYLEIHHMPPFEFNELIRKYRFDGTVEWHRKPENLKNLVTLCTSCHELFHNKKNHCLVLRHG